MRAAPAFGFARTASRLHAIVPAPTTSTCDGFVARAPAPGANATAHATARATPATAPASLLVSITVGISLKVIPSQWSRGDRSRPSILA